jgi:hypothetical protein
MSLTHWVKFWPKVNAQILHQCIVYFPIGRANKRPNRQNNIFLMLILYAGTLAILGQDANCARPNTGSNANCHKWPTINLSMHSAVQIRSNISLWCNHFTVMRHETLMYLAITHVARELRTVANFFLDVWTLWCWGPPIVFCIPWTT